MSRANGPGQSTRLLLDIVDVLSAVLKIIGREDFIAMKIYAGGPQDLIDASHAIAVSKSDLDTELLRRLARRFGSETAETCERLLAAAP